MQLGVNIRLHSGRIQKQPDQIFMSILGCQVEGGEPVLCEVLNPSLGHSCRVHARGGRACYLGSNLKHRNDEETKLETPCQDM